MLLGVSVRIVVFYISERIVIALFSAVGRLHISTYWSTHCSVLPANKGLPSFLC